MVLDFMSMTGVSPTTVIVSSMAVTSNVALTEVVFLNATSTPSFTNVLNPCSANETLYAPTGRKTNLYAPP
ncbi:unnamed protein product [marine sediment metagenome]|uniref:Uncharacterized protein n=1 Tax=marine sediment metagenome TaxID=412755 RepID=X1PBX6_9ZZZZ